jgi:hypothetical protein
MQTRKIELIGHSGSADRDRGVLGVYQGALIVAAAGAAFGARTAIASELTPNQRKLSIGAAASVVAASIAGVIEPVPVVHFLRRSSPPWLLPGAAIVSIAATGAEHSPMFFPGLLLTGFGGGRLGPTRLRRSHRTASLALGAGASLSYLAAVISSAKPWRYGVSAQLQWAFGMVPTFLIAPLVGGEIGDLALSLRRLERMRRRDRKSLEVALEDLPAIAANVATAAGQLEAALLRIAVHHPVTIERRDDMHAALEGIRGGVAAHTLAPLLVAAANEEPLDLRATLDTMLDTYRAGLHASNISISLIIDLPLHRTFHPRWTGALVRAAKIAVDNSYRHQSANRLRTITVKVCERSGRVELSVCDDGGGKPPREASWGTGLRELYALIHSLSGSMTLRAAESGVELCVALPASTVAPSRDDVAVPVAERVDTVIRHCLEIVRPVTWIGGIACLAYPRARLGIGAAATFTAMAIIDRTWSRRTPESRVRARVTQTAISLLWPRHARPASGWTGLSLIDTGMRFDTPELLAQTALMLAGYLISAVRVRKHAQAGLVEEAFTFTAFCAATGYIAAFAQRRLAKAEAGVLGIRERTAMLEQLGRSVYYRHEIISNLRASEAWYGEGISDSEDGQLILALIAILDDLTLQLLGTLTHIDPIRELKEHLEVRLDPVNVTVTGSQPVRRFIGAPGEDLAVRRARQQLALARVADEIADGCLAHYPPGLNGKSNLERVHIHLSTHGESEMMVSVRPIPPSKARVGDLAGLQYALAQLAGEIVNGYDDAGLLFTVPADALISQ